MVNKLSIQRDANSHRFSGARRQYTEELKVWTRILGGALFDPCLFQAI